MPFRFLALALAAPLLLAGCSDDSSTPGTGSTATPPHAGAAAVPGSHEDWCGEHAVPESMCTRCDPSLSAAFKATGIVLGVATRVGGDAVPSTKGVL